MLKKSRRYVCSFWHDPRTWQTDGQTDRRKNRQTPHDSIDWACIASRGKNASQHVPIYLQQFPSYSNQDCKKSQFLHTQAFIFCLPWRRPCGNHAKRCMNEKTIQCLPNPSQHVPIYLQQFPSYLNCKCKKSPFSRTAAHIFVSPGDAPATITQYIAWMERQFNACQTPRNMYLSIFNSFRVIQCLSQCVSPKIAIFTTFLFPLGTPLGQSR